MIPVLLTAFAVGATAAAAQGVRPAASPRMCTSRLPCAAATRTDPHDPTGTLRLSRSGQRVTATGVAYDPDTTASIRISYRVDAGPWHTTTAGLRTPRAPIAGEHGYRLSWALSYRTHTVCVLALNVSAGTDHTSLGCPRIVVARPLRLNHEIAAYAKTFVGRYPYAYGGRSPATGFDCSGLTYYVYRHFGRRIAGTAQAQYGEFRRLTRDAARPGDLVFFHSGPRSVFHVGVYEGAHMMVAAATPQDGIRFQSIWSNDVTYGTVTH